MFSSLFSFVGNAILFIFVSFFELLFKLRYALTLLVACLLAFKVAELAILILGPSFIPFGVAAICIPFCYLMHVVFNYFQERSRARLEQLAHPREIEPFIDEEYLFQNANTPSPILHNFGHINNREMGYFFYTEPTPMGLAFRNYVTGGMPFRL